jgi:hypothetical protein
MTPLAYAGRDQTDRTQAAPPASSTACSVTAGSTDLYTRACATAGDPPAGVERGLIVFSLERLRRVGWF